MLLVRGHSSQSRAVPMSPVPELCSALPLSKVGCAWSALALACRNISLLLRAVQGAFLLRSRSQIVYLIEKCKLGLFLVVARAPTFGLHLEGIPGVYILPHSFLQTGEDSGQRIALPRPALRLLHLEPVYILLLESHFHSVSKYPKESNIPSRTGRHY